MNPQFTIGSEDYREAALLRMSEAERLREASEWIGSIYLAGRAAEAVLRSLYWLKTRQQDTGHDLKALLKRVFVLLPFPADLEKRLDDAVNEIAVVWRNDLRFTGEKRFRRLLKESGRLHKIGSNRVQGDPVKANALSVLGACATVVALGEPICKRSKKN